MRIVLDTNVLVSGLLKRASSSGRILDYILSGAVTPVLESRLVDEYQRVLARPRLKIPPKQAQQVLMLIIALGKWVTTEGLEPLPDITPDPGDIPFAQTALAAKVDALITGNSKHFLFLKDHGIQALSPTEFLAWYEPRQE